MMTANEFRYTSCAVCGKDVDKLPFEFGGSKEGAQISEVPDIWVCSSECWDKKVDELIKWAEERMT